MLILSTFNSDYLQNPLQSLLEKFTPESLNIKYVNKNLMLELLNQKSNIEEKSEEKSYVTLFRISDFIEKNSSINENKLEKHLDIIVNLVISLKQEKGLPFLVFLCPSSSADYNNNPTLEKIEKNFIEKLNQNKIHTLTLSNVIEKYGDMEFENPIEGDTHIPYRPKFYAAMACLLARKLHAIIQKPCKVIAVDCDDTLWEGVAADVGIEAVSFKEHNIFLQNYLVEQQKKGIIICLCSRNEENTVLDVFSQRQKEMPLKLDYITKYKINLEEKAENIRELAMDLNLLPDSFRFIDDNPTQINNVNQIPGVLCITMPQNIKDCKNHWIFDIDEHSVLTETDKNRPELFKQAEIKAALATKFRDPIEYLRSKELGQSIVISKIDYKEEREIKRVSQLSGKTNQFNSFPEVNAKSIDEINKMITSDKKVVFVGRINDKFSPEEIDAVSMCSIERNNITINNFFVSCRSFGRGIEFEMLKHIAQTAQEKAIENINIRFKKSKKNKPASIFLNILSEKTNKNPTLKVDFSTLQLEEEVILCLSTREIIELELDALVRASLKAPKNYTQEQQNKEITFAINQKINENYLIELKEMTGSLDDLVNKFFIDNKRVKLIPELEDRVNSICTQLLGEKGQNCSLVERGLDSLKATELRSYLYENYGADIAILELLCQKMTVFRLIEHIKEQRKTTEPVVQNDSFYGEALPASFQQQRLWLAEQNKPVQNSADYHMIACYKVSKNLDVPRFKLVCQKIIGLYDVFGSSFFMQDGVLTLSVLAPEDRKLNFQEILIQGSLNKAIQLEIDKPWSMKSKAPLMRIILFKDSNYHILFHVHHAIFDAISLKNFLDRLSKIYENNNVAVPEPRQYSEFIRFQQKKLANEASQKEAYNFWKNELSRVEAVTTLPIDQPVLILKPATEQTAERYPFTLNSQDFLALNKLAQSAGVTCFTAIYALFAILIASYTYQKNIALLTAMNGRDEHAYFDEMIGFFVNLLVYQFDLKEDQKLNEYLKYVNEKFRTSQKFQDIPFNKIQEILHAQDVKDILLSPAFIYQSYSIPELIIENEAAKLELPEQTIIFDERKTCRFGHFTLFAQSNNEKLNFIIEYAKDLFSTAFIERFAKNFLHLIRQASCNPEQTLEEISVVCDDERDQLVELSQGQKFEYTKEDNLISRFQCNVKKYPDHTALCYGQERFSYKELDQKSTNLGHALSNAGVEQGDYVGIYLEAHLFFIAELAILKIGAVFVPLAKLPKENEKNGTNKLSHLNYIIENAGIKFILGDDKDQALKEFKISLIDIENAMRYRSDETLNIPNFTGKSKKTTMEDDCCILYTSGSEGNPKGVILKNKGIYRVIKSLEVVMPGDKIAQTANQAFDAAQLEFWLALDNGACLVIFDKNDILETTSFGTKLEFNEISHMWLTAGLFTKHANVNSAIFNKLKYLMVGGDVVSPNSVQKVLACEQPPTIINGYGPTEASIFALTYTFNKKTLNDFSVSPIGRPICNTSIQIATCFGQLAPLGAFGLLYISGDGLGGYLKLPQLEEEVFIYNKENSKKMYDSRDLVRWSTGKDLQVLFASRKNGEQVKINGNLVSVAEVQKALYQQNDAIAQVEVFTKKIKNHLYLIAAFTVHNGFEAPSEQSLRKLLKNQFGGRSYMIPSIYVPLEKFPLNHNHKLDRKALLNLDFSLLLGAKNQLNQLLTENEQKILEIFKEILPFNPNLNIEDSFFDIGGSSIQVVELAQKVKQVFEKPISYDIVYQNPSVIKLAKFLEKDNELEISSFIELKSGDANLPVVIFIHPAGGGISCFSPLIAKLAELNFDNACYGIEDPLLRGHDPQLKLLTLKEMAKNYFDEIRNKFETPIVLAGFSFGGLLAWEIAQLFETNAKNNNLVKLVLFDTWVVSCAAEDTKDRLMKDVIEYCAKQRSKGNVDKNLSDMLALLAELCEHHQDIGFKFQPNRLEKTPVYLYKAIQLDDNFSEMNKQDENNYLLKFIKPKLFKKSEINASHYTLLENSAENSLANDFFKNIKEINGKIILKKDNNLGNNNYSTFFSQPTTRQEGSGKKQCDSEERVKGAR